VKINKTTLSVVAVSVVFGLCHEARADASPDEVATPSPRHETVGQFELGYRGSFVTSAGLNPFSTDDYLAQLSLVASRTLFVRGPLSFAGGVSWDHGGTSATSRGDATSLLLDRLTVPLEGRLQFRRWGYAFLRVAPGAAALRVEVDDPSAPAPLKKSQWAFATDLSAGYSFPIWTVAHGAHGVSRLWLQAEGGYGWMPDASVDLGTGAMQASNVNLAPIAMRGGFFRAAVAASF
jgi:hypothetical protein